ncbi:MAG: hypothetical protein ACOYLD_15140 [Anaerohalosphaeraceae bacterium]|jgi:hypothetical protein
MAGKAYKGGRRIIKAANRKALAAMAPSAEWKHFMDYYREGNLDKCGEIVKGEMARAKEIQGVVVVTPRGDSIEAV